MWCLPKTPQQTTKWFKLLCHMRAYETCIKPSINNVTPFRSLSVAFHGCSPIWPITFNDQDSWSNQITSVSFPQLSSQFGASSFGFPKLIRKTQYALLCQSSRAANGPLVGRATCMVRCWGATRQALHNSTQSPGFVFCSAAL